MVKRTNSAILDWVVCLGLPICAFAVSAVVGLVPLWQDALVYTVIVFAAILTALRPPWRQLEFWQTLGGVFAAHTLVVLWAILVLQEFPDYRRRGVPKLTLCLVAAVEGVFIGGVLWKRIAELKTSKPQGERSSL